MGRSDDANVMVPLQPGGAGRTKKTLSQERKSPAEIRTKYFGNDTI
jgi:hypothetical protein